MEIHFAGTDNLSELPCTGTIQALDERGIMVLVTDDDGTIIVTASPEGYTISNANGDILRR